MNDTLKTSNLSRPQGLCGYRKCALQQHRQPTRRQSGPRFLVLAFRLWVLVFLAWLAPSAFGQQGTVYSVNIVGFKMAVGTMLDDAVNPESGTAWYAAGPAGPMITVAAGNLVTTGLPPAEGEMARIAGVMGPAARLGLGSNYVSGSLYYSLTLKVTDLGTLGPAGGTLAAFNNGEGPSAQLPAPLGARLLIRSRPGGFQLGISKSTTDAADYVWAPPTFWPGEQVFVVAKYTFQSGSNDDEVALWLNPSLDSFGKYIDMEGGATSSSGPDLPQISSFVLMQRPPPVLPLVTLVDEVRISTAWAGVTQPWMDFGDAPDGPYPTYLPNGARHLPGALRFGALLDAELNGQPVDLDGADEGPDGIMFPASGLTGGVINVIDIEARGGPGHIDIWVDMDGVPGFGAADRVLMAAAHPGDGMAYPFPIVIPPGAASGLTWARLRISRAGGLPPHSYGDEGEVADFKLAIIAPPQAVDIRVVSVGETTLRINEDTPFSIALQVSNAGSATATDVELSATLPPEVSVLGVFHQDGHPADDACYVTGNLVTCRILSLAPGEDDLITIMARAAAEDLDGDEFTSLDDLTVMARSAETDLSPADNQIALPVFLFFIADWGDAPDGFPVTNMENGARARRKAGFYLGGTWDLEANGTHSPNADYDDLHGATPDDETGISFTAPVAPGAPASVTVQAPAGGMLDAWADFNGDLDWADADEQIFASEPLVPGANVLKFNVPTWANGGIIFSRWRLSETGGLGYTDFGGKGEVEDHPILISDRLDFGDAPIIIPVLPLIITTYPVTLARDGARHDASDLHLGSEWDSEIDGQPSTAADRDDLTGPSVDDEDGWAPVPFVIGYMMTINVNVTGSGLLDLWVDWDHSYGWDLAEHAVAGWPVWTGLNVVPVNVPAGIPTGQTYARFRLSTPGSLVPSGYAVDGEVEDYVVEVIAGAGPNDNQVNYNGVQHNALGQAMVSLTATGLEISRIGSSGQDGVALDLRNLSSDVALSVSPVELGANGSALGLAAYGTLNDQCAKLLAHMRLESNSGLVNGYIFDEIEDFGGVVMRAEIYNGPDLAGVFAMASRGHFGSFTGPLTISELGAAVGDAGQLEFSLNAAGMFTYRPPSGTSASGPVTGNRLRIVLNIPAGGLDGMTDVTILGQNLGTLTIRSESILAMRPRLRIERAGPRVILRWDSPLAVLQGAPTVQGPWKDLARGTTSYETIPGPSHTHEFYRLSLPDEPLEFPRCSAKRNVLLIIADDVGVDQMPVYINYHNTNTRTDDDITVDTSIPETHTPTLWRLATAGVTFVNAWSSPTCSPTRAGLYTGTCSFRHGVYSPTQPNLPATATTIAQVLNGAGYTSGLFGKWHLGDPTATPAGLTPIDFGWDRHYGSWGGMLTSYYDWKKVTDTTTAMVSGDDHYATHENVNDALAWIGAQTGPWMSTVAFNAGHWAQKTGLGEYYEMPPDGCPYKTRTGGTDKETYRSMLECMDRSISELLAGIDPVVLANTTIIFMGDNGTDGPITDHFPTSPVSHAKASLYEGGVHVPLIIADGYAYLHRRESPSMPFTPGSGRVASPGRFERSVVQTMDLFATIARIGGGDASTGLDSVSMVPYLNSAWAAPQRSMVFAETRTTGWTEGANGWNVAMRDEVHNHKLIIKNYGSCTPTYELYDLANDRWETDDLMDDMAPWPVWLGTDFLAPLEDLLGVAVTCP